MLNLQYFERFIITHTFEITLSVSIVFILCNFILVVIYQNKHNYKEQIKTLQIDNQELRIFYKKLMTKYISRTEQYLDTIETLNRKIINLQNEMNRLVKLTNRVRNQGLFINMNMNTQSKMDDRVFTKNKICLMNDYAIVKHSYYEV